MAGCRQSAVIAVNNSSLSTDGANTSSSLPYNSIGGPLLSYC